MTVGPYEIISRGALTDDDFTSPQMKSELEGLLKTRREARWQTASAPSYAAATARSVTASSGTRCGRFGARWWPRCWTEPARDREEGGHPRLARRYLRQRPPLPAPARRQRVRRRPVRPDGRTDRGWTEDRDGSPRRRASPRGGTPHPPESRDSGCAVPDVPQNSPRARTRARMPNSHDGLDSQRASRGTPERRSRVGVPLRGARAHKPRARTRARASTQRAESPVPLR
jgi:hypothetical protein